MTLNESDGIGRSLILSRGTDLNGEPFVQFIVGVEHKALPLCAFFAQVQQGRVFVAFEQAWYFTVGQQGVHAFEKAAVHHVGFIEKKDDLFSFAARATEQLP